MKQFYTLLFGFIPLLLFGQKNQTTININADGMDKVFILNRNGHVEVKGVEGNTIKLNSKNKYSGNLRVSAAETRELVRIDTILVDGGIVFYLTDPRYELYFEEDDVHYRSFNDNWSNWKKRPNLQYTFDMVVEVPYQMMVTAKTHHNGDVLAENLAGAVKLNNHHGSIYAQRLAGNAKVNTHHGDIEVSFIRNPKDYGKFHTHHGEIRAKFAQDLSADIFMDSHHGEFYSEFDWSYASVPVVKEESNRRDVNYKIKARNGVRIGDGGVSYSFNTHHGDVYILQTTTN